MTSGLPVNRRANSLAMILVYFHLMKNALVHQITILAALSVATAAQSSSPQNHRQANPVPGRSVVSSRYGVVAATQPMAAMSGVQILERGGNAVDAAIATNAVLGLMEPVNNGIGGDLFAIVYESKTGKLYGLNASGWASKAETPEMLRAKGITKMPESGAWTVTVPGTVAGWRLCNSGSAQNHFRNC